MLVKNLTIVIINDRRDQLFEQALLSAAIAEEIIVFDQVSHNNWSTLEKKLKKINPKLNFRLIFRKNPILDFASLRNKAIAKVHTPWLMFLDSDEILSQQNLKQLPTLLANEAISAYRLKRVDYFHQKKLRFGETGNCSIIRLARSNAIRYQRVVHEIPIIAGQVANSHLEIKHYPHHNLNDFLNTVNNYAELEASYRFSEKYFYPKLKIILELLIYPNVKFLVNYLLKLGFADGFAGLAYAVLMSFHSLLVRVYLYEKYFLN